MLPRVPLLTPPALLPGKAAPSLITGGGPKTSPVASRPLPRRRAVLPRPARRATHGISLRVAVLLPADPALPTATMMNSGIAPKAAAFRTAGLPVLPVLLPVQNVRQPDGIGILIRNAAFLTNPTLLLRNALRDGIGMVRTTSVSQYQPLHLPATLNLLSTIAGSDQGSFAPR